MTMNSFRSEFKLEDFISKSNPRPKRNRDSPEKSTDTTHRSPLSKQARSSMARTKMKKWCDAPNPPLTDFSGELDRLWESINAPAFQKLVTECLQFQELDETLTSRQMCIRGGQKDKKFKFDRVTHWI